MSWENILKKEYEYSIDNVRRQRKERLKREAEEKKRRQKESEEAEYTVKECEWCGENKKMPKDSDICEECYWKEQERLSD
jgi:hypothetical protein